MLAFSIDYYGIFFGATQSVELFCTYDHSRDMQEDHDRVNLRSQQQQNITIVSNVSERYGWIYCQI